MGIFKRNKPEPQVRRDRVLRLLQLQMKESDLADRYIDEDESHPGFLEFRQAVDDHYAAARDCTLAERRAAYEAAHRHGY